MISSTYALGPRSRQSLGSIWEAAGAVSAVRKLTPPPAAGVHPKVVQERLGHSQVSVTLDTYGHVAPSLQREAADRLDGLLENRSRRGGGAE